MAQLWRSGHSVEDAWSKLAKTASGRAQLSNSAAITTGRRAISKHSGNGVSDGDDAAARAAFKVHLRRGSMEDDHGAGRAYGLNVGHSAGNAAVLRCIGLEG